MNSSDQCLPNRDPRGWRVQSSGMIVFLIIAMQMALVTRIAFRTAPNADELPHLAAGLYHWQTGRFDAYQVNPPLVRMWCTWPIAMLADSLTWPRLASGSQSRLEWALDRFLRESWDYVTLRRALVMARLMNLPITALGAFYCFQWGSVIGGKPSGVAALIFWSTCPDILACSASLCPDAAATALGLVASFHLCQSRSAPLLGGIKIGALIGLAILAKTTMIILLPPAFVFRLQAISRNGYRHECFLLASLAVATIAMVNLGYGYRNSGVLLGEFPFRCRLMTMEHEGSTVNRFSRQALGSLPVPLPFDFIQGLDRQKSEFERGKRSYLLGTWREVGWYQYYIVAACFRLPLGMLGAFVAAYALKHPRSTRPLAALAFTIIVFVSSQRGFSHHVRYALPAMPYLIIHSSALFAHTRRPRTRRLAWTMLGAACVGSLGSWPDSHSFCNHLAKAVSPDIPPLVDSSLDWGEDLGLAAQWAHAHPEARPLYHAVMTPDLADWMPVEWSAASTQFPPGWYVVSVQRLIDPIDPCHRLDNRRPVGRISRSLRVYRIDKRADIRRPSELPPLTGSVALSCEHTLQKQFLSAYLRRASANRPIANSTRLDGSGTAAADGRGGDR